MIKYVMHDAKYIQLPEKYGLAATTKIYQKMSVGYHEQTYNACCKQDLSENEC